MNTLRNLAALALLAFAAISPAHAEQADEGTNAPAIADGGSLPNGKDIRKLLEDKPEIADALKEQLSNHPEVAALASDGDGKAIAGALNEYLSKHPLKDGQDISDLARNGKEKAIAEALKARFGKRR
jgi:hypothetical protein